ncbi:MAG: putative transporter [Myxococcaceae bacterium]|nr:putative transporter [Myxococcaceae bacterium]
MHAPDGARRRCAYRWLVVEEKVAVPYFARLSRALRHRNYRLFFAGQSISLIGTWLTQVASSWLVYGLTKSALLLGVASFASQAPTFFLSPFVGVWVDRVDRHRVLLITQALAMLQSGLLAYFALRGTLDVTHIIALNAFQGLVSAVDIPTRQSFVVHMIEDRNDLPNALALNSSMVNAARLIGPTIAAVLIGLVGEAYCFLIDALSYIAVLSSLLAMRMPARLPGPKHERVLDELREGFRYVAVFRPIRAILLLLTVVSLVGTPYTVLLPVIAREVLHGGPSTLGALTASAGLGALCGALYLASRSSVRGLFRVIPVATLTFGGGLLAVSQSRSLVLTLPIMVLVGGAMMVQLASSNTILQTLVDEDKRGRVMSFFSMAVFGVAPFGSLVAGSLADQIGAAPTLLIGGCICCVAGLSFRRTIPALRPYVRPIYERLGIVPELARGVSEATSMSEPPPA